MQEREAKAEAKAKAKAKAEAKAEAEFARRRTMNPANRDKLRARVVAAAQVALAQQGYVSPLDVLMGIGWLPPSTEARWRQGRVSYLESGMQANLARISEAMKMFRAWAVENHLYPSETAYVARAPSRPQLRFSKSGDPTIERLYRTHWVSRELSEEEQQQIKVKASQPPELVVIQPHNQDWKCHRCGGSGELLMMEDPGPACLACVGLGDLVFLPAGDAKVSRRAKANSDVYAVVVRFSRTRKRYERQGLLVRPEALRLAVDSAAKDECDA